MRRDAGRRRRQGEERRREERRRQRRAQWRERLGLRWGPLATAVRREGWGEEDGSRGAGSGWRGGESRGGGGGGGSARRGGR